MILNLYISYHYTRQQLNARSIRKIIIIAQRHETSALPFNSVMSQQLFHKLTNQWVEEQLVRLVGRMETITARFTILR